MQPRVKSIAVTISAALVAAVIGGEAEALPALDRAPCDPQHAEVVGGCPGKAATLSVSDDERAAKWLVEQILNIDLYADPVIDFSAAEIASATGIEADRLDLDRIRARVLELLREASRWGEVRLRVEEGVEPHAADDDRKMKKVGERSDFDSARTGAAGVPSASPGSVAPAAAPRLGR